MKKRIVIHGAHGFGQRLAMKIDHIFDIVAMLDRNRDAKINESFDIPQYGPEMIGELDFDFIFVTNVDYEGTLREYNAVYGVPTEKIINMTAGHQESTKRLFYCLANEIYRLNAPGAVAEVGVDYGETAKYINLFFPDRKLYLFDTFGGFPAEDINFERDLNSLVESVTHIYDHRHLADADMVLRRMYFPEACEIKQGYFPESLDGLDERFAFVHIDCDLSNPIGAALEYFFPRLSRGGFICVHDYYNPFYPGVRAVVRRFCDDNGLAFIPDPQYGGVVIGGI